MGFRKGTVSYKRFRVVGSTPTQPDQELIDAIAAAVVRPPSVGAPPELQVGWCAGRHVLDESFDRETMAFGSTLIFGLRIDTCRVPPEMRKAYVAQAESEQAQASPTGFLNRAERKAAREAAEERCRQDLANGLHRSSKLVPVLWDLARNLVLAPAMSDASTSALVDLFRTTLDCGLQPLSAGSLAAELVGARGGTRDLDDARPTAFTAAPPSAVAEDGRDVHTPAVLWAQAGPEPDDFLGNEFVIWLWHRLHTSDGMMDVGRGLIGVVIDRVLDMACAWDSTGTQSLRADGPARLPEAIRALQTGKWPRKTGLVVANGLDEDEQFTLNLHSDRFLIGGLKLPKPGDDVKGDPRAVIEHRLECIRSIDESLVGLFDSFLTERLSPQWTTSSEIISAWIAGTARQRSESAPLKVDFAQASLATP